MLCIFNVFQIEIMSTEAVDLRQKSEESERQLQSIAPEREIMEEKLQELTALKKELNDTKEVCVDNDTTTAPVSELRLSSM